MSWPEVSLGEICKPKQHKTIPKSDLLEAGFVVYGANGPIGYYSDYTHDRTTIAITCRGATCGTINVVPPNSYVTGNAMALDELDDGRVDLSFLRYALEHKGFEAVINGAAQPQITRAPLLKYTLPLPPLDEQKRIAAILDQADELRRKRQRAIDRLGQLGQAIFHEMFGDFGGGGISVVPVGELTSKIGSGATPKGGQSAYQTEGIPLIRSMNVRDAEFSTKGLAFLDDEQAAKLDNVRVEANDVMLNITGASVARVCLAPADMEGARVNQHVSIIRPSKSLTSEFLEAFLLMPRTKRKLLAIAESGATRQAITKSQIEQMEVPVPPLPLQEAFIRRLETARLSASHMANQLLEFESLFSSLQNHAFRGEL